MTAAAVAIPPTRERPILFSSPMIRALLAGRKTQTRRIVNEETLKVSLPRAVRPDFAEFIPGAGPPAQSGTHRAALNPQGAVSVLRHEGGALGVKSGEFDFVCPFADGVTRLRPDRGGWEIVPHPGQRLWVKETWQYADWTEDGYPFVEYRADSSRKLREIHGREWAERLSDTWSKLSEPENFKVDMRAADRKWRPSIFMPRWASRLTLEVTGVRVQRLRQINFADIRQEGVECPEHDFPGGFCCSECGALRGAFERLWDGINGDRASWESNPWVWAVSFHVVSQ